MRTNLHHMETSPVSPHYLLCFCCLFLTWNVYSQCSNPDVMMFEDFNSPVITGANSAVIYGNGSSNHNSSYLRSGSRFGWFNVRNGMSNVNVYDRHIAGLCIDSMVEVSFWAQTNSPTNVTFSMIDDVGGMLATSTVNLGFSYQQYVFTFPATTAGMRFVVRCNSTGSGGGVDIIMEDLSISHCCRMILPIELKHFDAQCFNQKSLLTWKTDVKEGNRAFMIQRSDNAYGFKTVARVNAAKEGTQRLTYEWMDENSLPGTTYYRLVHKDEDGQLTYSNTIAVYCEVIEEIRVAPNPFIDLFTVYLPTGMVFPCTIEVLDYTGQKVHEVVVKNATQYVEVLLGDRFADGAYVVRVYNSRSHKVCKVIKRS